MSAAKRSVALLAVTAVLFVMFSLAIGGLQPAPVYAASSGEQWQSGGPAAASTVYTVTYTVGGSTGTVGVHNNAK